VPSDRFQNCGFFGKCFVNSGPRFWSSHWHALDICVFVVIMRILLGICVCLICWHHGKDIRIEQSARCLLGLFALSIWISKLRMSGVMPSIGIVVIVEKYLLLSMIIFS